MKRRTYGSGTIEERNGRYRARIYVGGKAKPLGTFATHEEAERVLNAARAALTEGRVETGGTTLRAWGEQWLERRELDGGADIRNDISRWTNHVASDPIANLALAEIRRRDVRDFMRRLAAKPATPRQGKPVRVKEKLSPATRRHVLILLRVAFDAAVEDELIDANPAHGVELPTQRRRTHEPWTYLTIDEQRAVATSKGIPEADRLRALFALFVGLRQGEQWNQELVDAHLDDAEPHIWVRYGGPNHAPPKNGKPRKVPLSPMAIAILTRWRELLPSYAKKNPHGLLFPTPRGCRRQKSKTYGWAKHLVAAGVTRRVRWHDLRHTCASSLVAGWWGRAWRLEEIRDLLGHSSIAVTERYAHLAPSALAVAAAETPGAAAANRPTIVPARPRALPQRPEIMRRARHDSNVRPADSKDAAGPSHSAWLDGLGDDSGTIRALAERYLRAVASRSRFSHRYGIDLAEAVLRATEATDRDELVSAARAPSGRGRS